jgi:NADPH:quinone reductase-like Zn-dependent oxidoreductase
VLIWGGSTIVGNIAIQIAKQLGCRVLSTCSQKNMDNVKASGADVVVDYNKDDAIQQLKEAAGGNLKYAFDTVGEVRGASVTEKRVDHSTCD